MVSCAGWRCGACDKGEMLEMVVRKECCRGMGPSRGGELGNTCHIAS